MKYNRAEIMKMAWAIRRESGCTMSTALKTAWAATKAVMEAKDYADTCVSGTNREYANRWENYGKSRTYFGVKVYTTRGMKKDIKVGYINNRNGEWIAA